MRLQVAADPCAAPMLPRLDAVVPSGCLRFAAAGDGTGPREQRDQSGAPAARPGRGLDRETITLPAAGLLTWLFRCRSGAATALTCTSRIT